jgi:hypothetical protein
MQNPFYEKMLRRNDTALNGLRMRPGAVRIPLLGNEIGKRRPFSQRSVMPILTLPQSRRKLD